jgi:hypothetical protein
MRYRCLVQHCILRGHAALTKLSLSPFVTHLAARYANKGPPLKDSTDTYGPHPNRGKALMHRRALLLVCVLSFGSAAAPAAERMRFWNLTATTIAKLYLAPAGTTKWGPNQCANDPDGTVSMDERLELKGVPAGRYDVKIVDVEGRSCTVRDVTLQAGKSYAFSLSEADLKDCTK